MGLELACYDLLPPEMPSFARGFMSALIATVSCYPLDTIRFAALRGCRRARGGAGEVGWGGGRRAG
jgi:hypothetical protein